ncbi:MAG: hypothetical protein HY000_22355 [Planctomycetes bacterium]|nr:hypothetical protein [Planctomycetota bacterium]
MIQVRRPPTVAVPPEVVAFAGAQGVSAFLPAILEMTQRKFPDAQRLAIQVEEDPEIPDDRHIVIEVDVAGIDPEQYAQADDEWGHELFHLCPAPQVCVFRLALGIL